MEAALYDLIYGALPRSGAYRKVIAETSEGLPQWVTPLSSVDVGDLERMNSAMRLSSRSRFVDLACGLGGPGLWIAWKTGARLTGVDFSSAAVEAARLLAGQLRLDRQAQFVTADATATGLPRGGFDALMSIDAIQFVAPREAALEIARLLRPGGRGAILTWEAIVENLPLATIVADYEPYFRDAGLTIVERTVIANARAREIRYYRALLANADELRSEMGEAALPLLHEAADGIAREHSAPRVRKVFIVAEKR